jgi:hypothetical protein
MSELLLIRDSYGPVQTFGRLFTEAGAFHTIERPWVKGPDIGGTPFESCIPDGIYQLIPHTRPDGAKVVALINEELGVWYQKDDRPEPWGRYLVLIHAGNYVEDIVGCIAPGAARTIANNRPMVTSSRAVMGRIGVQQYTSIEIRPTEGATDGP